MATLRWRKNPRLKGLQAIGAGPRGSRLYLDGEQEVASVNASRDRLTVTGWYWTAPSHAGLSIEHRNTCNKSVATETEAKAAAMAYIRECLSRAALKSTSPDGGSHG